MFKSAFDKQQSVFCDTETVFGALARYAQLVENAEKHIAGKIEHEYSEQCDDLVLAANDYHRALCNQGKVHILNERLTAAAQNARGFIGKSRMPVLQGFHLSTNVKPGYLAIEATDLEKTYREYVPVNRTARIETVVNDGKRFAEYMTLVGPEGSRLYQNHAGLSVMDSCNYRATFKTIDSSEFPVLATMPDNVLATFEDVKAFKTALKMAISGVAKTDQRPILTGVLFDFKPTLTLMAADGYKLTTRDTPVEATLACKVIIPAASLTQVVKSFSDDEPITMAIDTSGRVYFAQGNREIISSTISGTFPNDASTIPTAAYHIRFDLDELIAAVKTLKATTDKDHAAISITTGNDVGDSIRIVYLRCNGQESGLLIDGTEPRYWFSGTLDLYLDIYKLYAILTDLAKVTAKPKNVRPTKAQLKRGIVTIQKEFRYVEFGIALPQKSAALTLIHGGQSAVLMPLTRPEESYRSITGNDYPTIGGYMTEEQKQQHGQAQADSEYREWKRNQHHYSLQYQVRDRSDVEFRNGKAIWFDQLDECTYAPAIVDWYTEHYTPLKPIVISPALPTTQNVRSEIRTRQPVKTYQGMYSAKPRGRKVFPRHRQALTDHI